MEYYEQLLSNLRRLNPGTRYLINRLLNREKFSFIEKAVSRLKKINELEPEMENLSPEEMQEKTVQFKQRLQAGASLDDLLVEAFALVREAGKRTVNMRHFDVQIIGGIILHSGRVAEMATGEGKTLVATLPLYLNALEGKGGHLVTVNDYLAKRDTQWMGPIYHSLGLSVGCIISLRDEKSPHTLPGFVFDPTYLPADSRFLYLRPATRKEAYRCDITYGVGSEFGFDYLRDNMALRPEDQVQRELNFALIDEVDSILIDEARTPLIISGPSEESPQRYYDVDRLVRKLNRATDYTVDEETQTLALTDEGIRKVEHLLGVRNLYDGLHTEVVHHINQSLRAHTFFKRDQEYVVKNGQVIIVDEFTGRLMPGRRWSDGLHQAVEAKEGVPIESENQTLATISFQNYFRLYRKIAGMTGTALTEAAEFHEIYKLDPVAIPTNKPLLRTKFDDEIYKTEREKFNAVLAEVEALHKAGRPILVGTVSIEKAEKLSGLLRQRRIPHQVLHGKNHEAEAVIIAQAGRPKAVTIATQMAGRGVDIILGGNPEIIAREETIQLIRSRNLGTPNPKSQKAFLDVLVEIEETYKKTLTDIEQSFKANLESAKRLLNEKEKVFAELDQKIKDGFERMVFLRQAGPEYEELEPRLEKLKEKYQSALEAHNQAEMQGLKPENLKELKEALTRAYQALESFKDSLRSRFGVYTRQKVEDQAGRLYHLLEKPAPEIGEAKKSIARELSDYLAVLTGFGNGMTATVPEEVKKESVFQEFSNRSQVYLNELRQLEKTVSEAGASEGLQQLLSDYLPRENTMYRAYLSSLENMQEAVLRHLGGTAYQDAEEEYQSAHKAYEKLQSQLDKKLAEAREDYEKTRKEQEEQWQKAREELEKNPQMFKAYFESLLAKHKEPWLKDHQKVVEAGGLHIIGSERYEARRIDNQLVGRAGRQGDPGSSKYYLSLEDDLLRIFGSERLMGVMSRLPEGENITHPLITRMINNAQRKVEARNFEIRKQLLEFDNVLNEQRKVVYSLRQDILQGKDLQPYVADFVQNIADATCTEFLNEKLRPDAWNIDGFSNYLNSTFGLRFQVTKPDTLSQYPAWREDLKESLCQTLHAAYVDKQKQLGNFFPEIQKMIMLQVIDSRWRSHLRSVDELREGIGLRAYAQKDPLIAYKHEGYQMFQEMLFSAQSEILSHLLRVQVSQEPIPVPSQRRSVPSASFVHKSLGQFDVSQAAVQEKAGQPLEAPEVVQAAQPAVPQQPYRRERKVGRNEPCPCGSGKKYKKCCGKNV